MPIVDVLLPLALDRPYSYRADDALALEPGAAVRIPFGPRETIGVVWARHEDQGDGRGGNLKKVIGKVEWPELDDEMRAFVDWVARYTLAPKGLVMRMALRNPDNVQIERARIGVRLTGTAPQRLTPQRSRVIEAAGRMPMLAKTQLALEAGVSPGVVNALIDDGVLETLALEPESAGQNLDPAFAAVSLSGEQRQAAAELVDAVRARSFASILLEGVTGSGKTEVYFEAIAEALHQRRQALILMPEIALTAQFLERFKARFGGSPAEWHSGVSSAKRGRSFTGISTGDVLVAAGARSALFLPFRDLGVIIVDEEHEAAYKQEDGVHYHARDMAIVRAQLAQCPVVLASATPSIESRVNAERGRYRHIRLPERFGGRSLPELSAIDMRIDGPPRGQWIAPRLEQAVKETVARGEQAILFLNRRGFAPLTLCRSCGHRWQCPNCTAWLVEHRFRRSLVCHHCGHVERSPSLCVECKTEDSLSPVGPGVERLAEETAVKFDGIRQIVLSSDFPGGAERLRQELQEIAEGHYQLVIGTQLIAKGHNFPNVTLAGVVDADVGLASGDPRAAERTFQLLQQVTGRAGRGDRPGRGILQTYQPQHPVIAALLSGDGERFYREEIAQRREAGLPPFGRLAGVVVSARTREEAEAHARALARAAFALSAPDGPFSDIMTLGPAEAPIAVIRGLHRFRLLLKAPRSADLQGFIRSMLAAAGPGRGSVRVGVDMDPMSFL
ncbi:MAG: primosomal protein N' [Beijerinckiaceae bacterium]|nr:primosomal protein N' [Beijerinckiaceae bacterium]